VHQESAKTNFVRVRAKNLASAWQLKMCSSHASATTTCKQSRSKQEGKDQAKRHLKVPSMHMEARALFGRIVWHAEGTNNSLS